MPWVKPGAVAVTIEQCLACAGCGARLKAAIAPTATAATNNLVMALSFLSFSLTFSLSQILVVPPGCGTRQRLLAGIANIGDVSFHAGLDAAPAGLGACAVLFHITRTGLHCHSFKQDFLTGLG
jgi:hypothetical protein